MIESATEKAIESAPNPTVAMLGFITNQEQRAPFQLVFLQTLR